MKAKQIKQKIKQVLGMRIGQTQLTIPQTFDVLTERQINDVFKVIHDTGQSFEQKRLDITRILIRKKMTFFNKWEAEIFKEYDGAEKASNIFIGKLNALVNMATSWLFGIVENRAYIKAPMIKPPLGQLKNRNLICYPPAENLSNISVYEFAYAEGYYMAYNQTKSFKHLALLIATLYRPHKPKTKENKEKSYEGDIRQPLLKYEATLDGRAQRLTKKMTLWRAMAILHYYETSRKNILHQLHPKLKTTPTPSKLAKDNVNAWLTVIMELSGGKFGDINQTCATSLHTIIAYLNHEQGKIKK